MPPSLPPSLLPSSTVYVCAGQRSELPYDVDGETALQHEAVRSAMDKAVTDLIAASSLFLVY